MFTPYDPGRRWLTIGQAAEAMDTTPEQVAEACQHGVLRWTVTANGVPLVEPAIITRHG